ncbi:hypothetical protein HAX54_012961 [Datura stramonium]|uniref:Uncharacterized protein n=1 Tax=Datura stramonium TaxID=4076 RepID=A0ABS8TLK0_DATST|nr:hypothetical protein [Datura stramonium]
MVSCLPHVKTHSSSPQFLIPNSKISATRNLQISRRYGNVGSSPLWQPLENGERCILSSKCAEGGSVGEIENKLEKQIGTEEDLTRIERPTGKCCEEVGGMVESLECLEREAIMGEDEGKEPVFLRFLMLHWYGGREYEGRVGFVGLRRDSGSSWEEVSGRDHLSRAGVTEVDNRQEKTEEWT